MAHRGKRILTAEEQKLWDYVTRADTRLQAPTYAQEPAPSRTVVQPRNYAREMVFTPHDFSDMPLLSGAYAGIDRNTADTFRKGKYPIDATLDLHGMSREKAHMALMGFVRAHYERGSRCVLVITGKGVRKDVSETPGKGILREMLPVWLAEPGLRPMVLALDQAKQNHGGSGAYYVLLRRKR
jgi:DNA-nicking Smr family endonuclease